MLKRFAALSIVVPTLTQEQFAAGLKAEAALWADIIKRGKIVAK